MLDYLWHSTIGLLGLGGAIIAACGAIAYFFPPFRKLAIEIGGLILAVMAIYGKGVKDRAAEEAKRKEEAVKKAQADYDRIDKKPETPDTITDKLNSGRF